jgi:hypothetical protein
MNRENHFLSISSNIPSVLFIAHLPLSKTALDKTFLDTDGNIGWDQSSELFNITTVNYDVSTDGSSDDTGGKSEKVVGYLGSTRVFIVESSNEDGFTAVWVEFLMNSTLWENL